MRARLAVAMTALLSTLAPALGARAQSESPTAMDDPYLALELLLGVGGEADAETTAAGVTGSGQDDLETSFGGAIAYLSPLHRHFALGGELSLVSWNTEGGDAANQDNNLLAALALLPQGRLPVSDAIELTLSVPIGLVVDFWGGDGVSVAGPGGGTIASANVDPAFGFEIGGLLGARFAVSSDVGLLVHVGYLVQSFEHSVEVTALGVSGSQDVSITLGQPRLQLGVAF